MRRFLTGVYVHGKGVIVLLAVFTALIPISPILFAGGAVYFAPLLEAMHDVLSSAIRDIEAWEGMI